MASFLETDLGQSNDFSPVIRVKDSITDERGAVEEGKELSYGEMDFFPLASLSCFSFYLVSISEISSLGTDCELICTQSTYIYYGGPVLFGLH